MTPADVRAPCAYCKHPSEYTCGACGRRLCWAHRRWQVGGDYCHALLFNVCHVPGSLE